MVYSCMVPGNLPSQLEILSTGQTYYETKSLALFQAYSPGVKQMRVMDSIRIVFSEEQY